MDLNTERWVMSSTGNRQEKTHKRTDDALRDCKLLEETTRSPCARTRNIERFPSFCHRESIADHEDVARYMPFTA